MVHLSSIPAGAKTVGRGFYEVGDELHIDIDEYIVASGGDPADLRDRATALRIILEVAEGHGIPVTQL
jgi:hypothetical protein